MAIAPPMIPPAALERRPAPWFVPALAVLAAALAVVFAFDPARYGFYPRCALHAWTGLECAGCGSLRALHHLLHGRVAAAFAMNPLLVAWLPVLSWEIVRTLVRGWTGRALPLAVAHPGWAWAFLASATLWTIVRNVAA